MLVYWKLPFFMDKSFCSKRQIFAEGFSHFWHAKIDTSKVYLTTPDRKLNRFMSVFARCTFCEFYALNWVKFPYLEKERKERVSRWNSCTANILTVLSTAFGSVTFPTVIWLCMLPPKTAIDLKLYSSMSFSVTGTAIGCDHYCQITVAVNICSVEI